MKFGKKLAISSKKELNSETVHNKNIKMLKKIITKEVVQYICTQIILIDSVYRKD